MVSIFDPATLHMKYLDPDHADGPVFNHQYPADLYKLSDDQDTLTVSFLVYLLAMIVGFIMVSLGEMCGIVSYGASYSVIGYFVLVLYQMHLIN